MKQSAPRNRKLFRNKEETGWFYRMALLPSLKEVYSDGQETGVGRKDTQHSTLRGREVVPSLVTIQVAAPQDKRYPVHLFHNEVQTSISAQEERGSSSQQPKFPGMFLLLYHSRVLSLSPGLQITVLEEELKSLVLAKTLIQDSAQRCSLVSTTADQTSAFPSLGKRRHFSTWFCPESGQNGKTPSFFDE